MNIGSLKLRVSVIIEYLKFAWIANVPILLLVFALSFIDPYVLAFLEPRILGIALYTIFVGATISSYVATRNMQTNHLTVGTIIGVFSFLMNIIMLILIFPLIVPSIAGSYVGLVPFFVLGGFVGGLFGKRHRQQSE